MNIPDLSIIIVNWNTATLLVKCLSSILASHTTLTLQVIVVDNGSNDDSVARVQHLFPEINLIQNQKNVGFAKANNQGLNLSQGRYVLLLNSDTIASPDSLIGLVRFMDNHLEAGAVGPRLLCSDNTPQAYAFGDDPTPIYLLNRGLNQLLFRRYLHNWATDKTQEVDWVSGACLLVRRQVIDQISGLDENIFMYFEDNDWCLRMRKNGWKVYFNPEVSIIHFGGQSLSQNPAARQAYYQSLDYFYSKHYGIMARFFLRVGLILYRFLVSH